MSDSDSAEPAPGSPVEPAPPAAPGAPVPAAPTSGVPGPYPPPAPANPFLPRYREPWVNPAKRGAVLALAAAAAVVLLAVGVLLGLGRRWRRAPARPRPAARARCRAAAPGPVRAAARLDRLPPARHRPLTAVTGAAVHRAGAVHLTQLTVRRPKPPDLGRQHGAVRTSEGNCMEIWPGTAYPLGATYDGSGTNFTLFSEVAERVELCLFSADGDETRFELPEVDGFVWHAFLPGVEPGQRYGYRVYGPYDPAHGLRCNPNKLLLDPYAKAIDGTIQWDESLFGYHFGDPDSVNDDDSATHMPKCVVVNPFFDWATDRSPRHPYAESVIYEAHVKGMTAAASRDPGGDARHLRRHGAPGHDRPPDLAGHHHARTDARAPLRQRLLPRRQGAVELLGLQHHRLLRARLEVHLQRQPRRPGAGVQGDGARAARRQHRGHPRRGLQPHRRGQPHGSHAVVPRHRQRRLLPARRRLAAALHGLHRHRQHAQRAPSAHPAADHGLAALLGHRDARGRVPLRPRGHPGPGVLRRRPAVVVLRPRPAGPGREPGEADRRAVGRRPRRLPGRQLPAAVDRVERQVPRHRARLLARRARDDR